MVAVQARAVHRLSRLSGLARYFQISGSIAHTVATGLRVPKSFADALILKDLYESHGQAITASDAEILAAQAEFGRTEGLFPAPEGAATLVAARKLVEQKWIRPDERVVLFNTGSGLKYLDDMN